ncbi:MULTISPECIES: flagellar hook-associated protein FlgK [Actinoplanes]|uniref:flagellar hook-associated protein FlgK n=1 Tax=Actinoplanes TaxID=1865 RepID=UPI0005F2C715|nr:MULTISPECIES: flagellar hook-associated protein FlgK [Actinoplanes]GLY03269.1 flagellar hook-associated protein 1 [Actinoplanes sp. NBRC 101535]
MGSTFGGLNTALTSLYAQRRGLDVTGQNIANANSEGYTRQRVILHAQNHSMVPGVYVTQDDLAGGVKVSSVERMRNAALDQRSYTEHANSAYHNQRTSAYNLIEDVFGEPSDTALQARLQDMWDGWNAVSANPDKAAPKSAMIEQATTVASTLNDAYASLNSQFASTRSGLDTYVNEVNKSAASIAALNKQIVNATNAGLSPNELKDQRGTEMTRLAELIGATATEMPNGSLNVYVGSSPMVSGFHQRLIEIEAGSATRLEDLKTVQVAPRWTDTKTAVGTGGQMGAEMELLASGGIVQSMSDRLDKVATKLADTVNTLHRAGYSIDGTTGLDFFVAGNADPLSAANIKVGVTDPDKVAVSSGDPTGTVKILNGIVADDLSELSTSRVGADAEYQSLIGDLGVAAQSSAQRRDIQNAVTEQVDAARDAESGVNLDEEMTNMLMYQRGYEAAARVLTTIDSMLDQLINRTGLVGR